MSDPIEECVVAYRRERHHIKAFLESVREFFASHPDLFTPPQPILHSIRSRLKDEDHLRDKLRRKSTDGKSIQPQDLLEKITDLAGIRLLHLHQSQANEIHYVIMQQLKRGDWSLYEEPVAYTWDPESKGFFENLNIRTELKESYYTSIHYVLKPRDDSPLCCEVQVRTLFEEAWGEIDHAINYPHKSPAIVCREQLLVLSRLVGAASRLTDSIFRAHGAVPALVE